MPEKYTIGDKIITYIFLGWGIIFGYSYSRLYSVMFLGEVVTVM